MRQTLFFLLAFVLVSCDTSTRFGVSEPFQPAGAAASASDTGPFAVSVLREISVERGRPDFVFDLYFPGDGDGALDDTQAPYPVFVLVQGGKVPRADYEWLAAQIASWGFVVALPQYFRDLALLSKNHTSATVDSLEELNAVGFFAGKFDLEKLAVGGHSLGGVTADRAIDKDPRFTALLMMGSFPGDNDGDKFSGAVLSIAGGSDCKTSTEKAKDGISLYAGPKAYAEISGVTHFQFTADETKDIEDGCIADISIDEAHRKISELAVAFLRSALYDDSQFLTSFTVPTDGITIDASLNEDQTFFTF